MFSLLNSTVAIAEIHISLYAALSILGKDIRHGLVVAPGIGDDGEAKGRFALIFHVRAFGFCALLE
jgi:hypothetical protein